MYQVTYRVRFHDVDHAGIIFFAAIQRYCHDAMEDMQRAAGIPLEAFFVDRKIGAPLVDVHASYRKPYRHGDPMIIGVGIERIGARSVVTRFDCRDPAGALCAQVRFVQAFIDAERFVPCPVPDDVRRALEAFVVEPVGDDAA